MEKTNEVQQTEELSFVSKSEQFIEKNSKKIIICVCVVAVVILAFFGFRKWVSEPRQIKANEALFAAEQLFKEGNYEAALNGEDNFAGLLQVIDKYGSTKAGNRAKYEAGICYLRLEQFDLAKQYLKKYKGKDQLTPYLKEMCLGDAEVGLGNLDAALKHYNAALKSDNFITAPIALFKAGMVYLTKGDNASAAKSFQRVKDDYPESSLSTEMDRYIAYAESL